MREMEQRKEMEKRREAEEEILLERRLEERLKEKQEEMHVKRQLDEKLRKETEEALHRQRKEVEKANLESEEDMFQRKWNQQKDRVRKGMSAEQLQEEAELLEDIHKLKLHEEEVDYKSQDSDKKLVDDRLWLLRKQRDELLEKQFPLKEKHTDPEDSKPKEVTRLEKSIGKPKLPSFDGSQFEEWKLEVTSLIESHMYSEHVLSHVIRNSVTGKARKVLLTLKAAATTDEIVKKMEDIYGNIRSGDSIVHEFYAAKQLKEEPCSEWGIRLETLFNQAVERGEIQEERKNAKLKERFWRGLVSEKIKVATRTSYESADKFDNLRKKARIEELETAAEQSTATAFKQHQPVSRDSTEKQVCQSIQNKNNDDKIDMLVKKIDALETSLDEMKRDQTKVYQEGSFRSGRGRYPYRHRGRGRPWNGGRGYQRDDNSTSRYNNKSDNKDMPKQQEKENSKTEDKPKN